MGLGAHEAAPDQEALFVERLAGARIELVDRGLAPRDRVGLHEAGQIELPALAGRDRPRRLGLRGRAPCAADAGQADQGKDGSEPSALSRGGCESL